MGAETLQCDLWADWLVHASQCAYDWQTLIAGLLALGAAAITAFFLRKQIRQTEKLHQAELQRRHSAARATLPLTLSGMIENVEEMMEALHAAKQEISDHLHNQLNFELPPVPANHIAELQEVIASTERQDVIELISEIIGEIQILWARARILVDERERRHLAGLKQHIDEWIILSAQIYALVEVLFPYARSETDEVPVSASWSQVTSVISRSNMTTPEIEQIIERRSASSENFWPKPKPKTDD